MKKVRIDKWLWSVRIFKSRSIATRACKNGKVTFQQEKVKASYLLSEGQIIGVRKNGFNLVFRVEKLINKRVSATLAAPCYTNLTPESELNKYQDWYIGKRGGELRKKGEGRPTKKERRTLEELKNLDFGWDEYDDDQ